MGRAYLRVFVGLTLLVGSACGSKGPAAPSQPGLSTPTGFRITRQQVFLTANQVEFSWNGSGSTYRLTVGRTSGDTGVLTAEVTGTSYTWMAPREEAVYYVRVSATNGSETSTPTSEFPVYTIDLRHVIDALFFRSGPMADAPNTAFADPAAGVWAPGTQLRVVVSNEAGEAARAASQVFADQYASLAGGTITATTELTADTFRTVVLSDVPPFAIYTRVLSGYCGVNVIACAFYGPAPIGPNRSLVTQNGGGGSVASAHELGHAYGMGHVHVGAAVRQELNFMMNPSLISNQMTEPEKNAIVAALSGGIAGGTRRSQALAAGLVLPFPPAASFGPASASTAPRDPARCQIGG